MVLMIVCLLACKKMDHTYKQFVVSGGITYAGKATSAQTYSGRNRIRIAWLRGADPNVVKAKVYWNNFQDSVVLAIPATGDTIGTIIPNLEEKQYNFVVKTYDAKGNSSVAVELLGESFGAKYEAYLVDRPVTSSELDESGKLTIVWGNANVSGGAYATEVQYTATNGLSKTKQFPIAEETSSIADYKAGTSYSCKTVYRPSVRSIDSFYTPSLTEVVTEKIKKSGLLVTTDSFAATSQLPKGGSAQFAFDDDVTTFWHTHHTPAPIPVFPHWIAVDLAKAYTITRAELICRPGVGNSFTTFIIQGSINGTTWTDYGSFTLIQRDAVQSFTLTSPAKMRYFRIYATAGPQTHTSLAEFSVFGYQ